MNRYLILLLTLLGALQLQAGELPPAFKAQYVVKKGPIELGQSSRELRYTEDGQLVFHATSDTTGMADLLLSEHIQETSYLKQGEQGVLPVKYEYQRKGKHARKMSQQFDWQQDSVTSRDGDRVFQYSIPPVTFDPSGYQVNLMIDLAAGDRDLEYHVAGRKKLRTYDIRHIRNERLQTVLGPLNTVVIQRDAEQITTMWCASDLHFLPVKIEHEEKGMTFTATLKAVTGLTGR